MSYYRVTTKVKRNSYFYWFLNSQHLWLQIEFIRNGSCHNLPIFWHPVLQNCRMYIICTYLQYKYLQQYLPSAADNTPHCTADTNLNWWRRCQWSAAASNHCVHLSTVHTSGSMKDVINTSHDAIATRTFIILVFMRTTSLNPSHTRHDTSLARILHHQLILLCSSHYCSQGKGDSWL